MNFKSFEDRLDKLLELYKKQNHFEILGVGEKAKGHEINKAYEELKEHLAPANLPSDCPPDLVVKCTKVFQYVQRAYATLSDETERASYLARLQSRKSQELMEHEPIFRAAIIELSEGHYKAAAARFQELLDRGLMFKDLKAYRIWAGLKCERNFNAITFEQVPPEERHSAPYLVAKGIHHRRYRQFDKALKALQAAKALDPSLPAIDRELNRVHDEIEKRQGSRTIIGTFIGKIRKGA